MVDVDCDAFPYVSLAVLPMGWSFAPVVAQWVLEDGLESIYWALRTENRVGSQAMGVLLKNVLYLWWVYIDDFLVMMGQGWEESGAAPGAEAV